MSGKTESIESSPRRGGEGDSVTRQGSTKKEGEKRQQRLTVRLKSDDLRQLETVARECGYGTEKQSGVSAYVRQIALGYTPPSMLDQEVIIHLCDLHGRLGRVGGLFKIALDKNDDPAIALRAEELSAMGAELKELVRDIRAGKYDA